MYLDHTRCCYPETEQKRAWETNKLVGQKMELNLQRESCCEFALTKEEKSLMLETPKYATMWEVYSLQIFEHLLVTYWRALCRREAHHQGISFQASTLSKLHQTGSAAMQCLLLSHVPSQCSGKRWLLICQSYFWILLCIWLGLLASWWESYPQEINISHREWV